MKDNIFVVMVPQLGVNDQTTTIVEWHIQDGERVTTGNPICTLETAKATFEMESETTGYLLYLVNAGEEVKINQPIALIGPELEALANEKRKYIKQAEKNVDQTDNPQDTIKATLKAKELAKKLGIDLSLIPVKTIIREQDVLDYHEMDRVDRSSAALNISWEQGRTPVAIYGSGKGAITLKECLDLQNVYQVVCFIDDNPKHPVSHCGLPVYHSSDLEEIIKKGIRCLATEIADGDVRLRIRRQCAALEIDLINVIHPKAFISCSAKIGKGNYIKSGAVIETNSRIGDCCIIDNGVIIAHDNIIGDGCHLAPGVVLGSSIKILDLAIIGIGVSVATGVTIGRGAIISVGSSVVKDVSDYAVIEGVPGKVVGERKIS